MCAKYETGHRRKEQQRSQQQHEKRKKNTTKLILHSTTLYDREKFSSTHPRMNACTFVRQTALCEINAFFLVLLLFFSCDSVESVGN